MHSGTLRSHDTRIHPLQPRVPSLRVARRAGSACVGRAAEERQRAARQGGRCVGGRSAATPAQATLKPLTFDADRLARKSPSGIDVDTSLLHFSIITYFIDPQAARELIHPRFDLLTIPHGEGEAGLLSVVPFVDRDFRFARFPWPTWAFAQTNYRIYVVDRETGEHAVWFLGTSLDSISVTIPRYLWKLPWHRAHIEFDCTFDQSASRYERYRMTASNSWADADVELHDTGEAPKQLRGFDDLETGMIVLTHPSLGYYYRRDGRLGSYSIWHERLKATVGTVQNARFDLIDSLGLASSGDASAVHSVLLQHEVDFTIYLPPLLMNSERG